MKRWMVAAAVVLVLVMPVVAYANVGDVIKSEIEEMAQEDLIELLKIVNERLDSFSANVAITSGSEAVDDSINAIAVVEYAFCESGKLVVIFENISDEIVPFFDVQMICLDENGGIVTTANHNFWAVLPGHQVIAAKWLTGISSEDFVSVDSKINIGWDEIRFNNYADDLVITSSNGKKGVILQVENHADTTLDELSIIVAYYFRGEIVDAVEERERDVKAGSVTVMEFSYPKNKRFQEIEYDDYKTFINISHIWEIR